MNETELRRVRALNEDAVIASAYSRFLYARSFYVSGQEMAWMQREAAESAGRLAAEYAVEAQAIARGGIEA